MIAASKMFEQSAKALFPRPEDHISLLELVFIKSVVDEFGTSDEVLDIIHMSAEEMFLAFRSQRQEGE